MKPSTLGSGGQSSRSLEARDLGPGRHHSWLEWLFWLVTNTFCICMLSLIYQRKKPQWSPGEG